MQNQKFERLFEPIKIGSIELKNRIAVSPMNQHGDKDGHPTMQYMCIYNARALGGFGLLTSGAILTDRASYEEYSFIPYLFPGSFNMGYWFDMVEGVHSMGTGTKIFAQMCIGIGRQGGRKGVRSPSNIPFTRQDVYDGMTKYFIAWSKYWRHDSADHLTVSPREMTIDEIKKAERTFIRSCELATVVGFDGIEIHACHGYLMHSFLTPRTNQRRDEYGGSPRNRARLLLNLIKGCKENFGDAVPIVVRVSGREYKKGGLTADDVRQICQWCEEAGADAISLSNSSGYDDWHHFLPEAPDNIELLEAQGKKLKDVIKIPVITTGLHTPELAEKAIRDGETDIVTMGRQAIADPEWPNKVKEGRLDEIIRCKKDNFCVAMGIMGSLIGMRCTSNPNFGKEQYDPKYWPKPMKGRIPESLQRWKPGLRWHESEHWKAFLENAES